MGKGRRIQKARGKAYVKDLLVDEIRWGFVVTSWRKKLWNKQIELMQEVDRICRAYHINYFALNGTMIGAARHHGFVPWDDDLDLGMFRPDYERFKQAAAEEIRPPYFLQSAYSGDRADVLFVLKVRDDMSTFFGVRGGDKTGHQGIFIDIFPIDSYDNTTDEGKWIYAAGNEILAALFDENSLKSHLDAGGATALHPDILRGILAMEPLQRFAQYERFRLDHFGKGDTLANLFNEGDPIPIPRSLGESFISVPFEEASIAVPSGYEEILTRRYGDWKNPVRWPVHSGICSADIPWRDYREKVDQEWQIWGDNGVEKYSTSEGR